MSEIFVNLKNKNDYVNRFNNDRISKELNNYLLDECKTIRHNSKINIKVKNEFNMTEEEQKKFKEMIKNSYVDDNLELNLTLKRLLVVDLIMFLIGIVFLLFYYLSKNIIIMSEILLIFGWVLIWESTYNLLFSRVENKIKIKKNRQIINGKIDFI